MTLQASVIIPTFQDWPGLQLCLDCLAAQTVAPDVFEVIVANNNPSADVPASLRLPANARIIHAATPGSYAARNLGLKAARAAVLFFTDSDCLPDPRWIEAGLERMRQLGPHGRIGGAVQLFPKGDDWSGPELFDRVHGMRQREYVSKGWCVTANLVARRATFDLVGPFKDDRFSGGDGDWNLRALEAGSDIVHCPATLIRHPARDSFAELAKKRRRLLGGDHLKEIEGSRPTRSLKSFFRPMQMTELRRTLDFPGLTDRQRMIIMWIAMRLAAVSLAEVIRLRYLARPPRRS